MKILLVGEFSGVAQHFEFGLDSVGCKISKIQVRDGYKAIGEGGVVDLIPSISRLRNEKFDITIFFTPLIAKLASLSYIINSTIMDRSKVCYYLPCTSDPIWLSYKPEKPDYRRPILGFIQDNNYVRHRNFKKSYLNHTEQFLSSMDQIFPLAYDYDAPYENLANCTASFMSFPYRIKDINRKKLEGARKYKAYHGVSRSGFKGSDIMKKFMFKKFDTECSLLTEKINFSDFQSNLLSAEIYFDQVYSKAPAYAAMGALNLCPTVVTGQDRASPRPEAAAPVVDFLTELEMIEEEQKLTSGERIDRNLHYLRQCHDPKKLAERLLNYG